jgi:pyridoxal phosphate enzyme (YggS family)
VPRLITGLDAARIRANLERIREGIADAGRDPAEVQVLAAVKYVALEEIGVLGEAGITLLGENRAQELEAKARSHPEFRWHFIGQLQSRKVKSILPHVELIHSVASDSALAQLERYGDPDTRILLEVNVAGEEGKAGIDPSELSRYLEAATVRVDGLMTMPPFAENPEDSRRHFARLRELASEHGLTELSMGTSQDFAVAASEGATIVRIGTTLYT